MIGLILLTACLGVYNLHSAAAAREPELYLRQIYWFAVACGITLVLLLLDYRITEQLAYVIYAVVCVLLVGVLVQGKTAGGAQRWLRLGPTTFQPSELAKLATVFCLARYFGHRMHHQGYSIAGLFRPLNPSRPLALVALLIAGWREPLLADPLGETARMVRRKLATAAPQVGDLIWFRVFLITLMSLGCAASVLWIIRTARERALLDPWPPGRRRRLCLLVVGLFATLGLALGVLWKHPTLQDPFGYMLCALYHGAASGGPYSEIRSGIVLRLFLCVVVGVYLGASILMLRRATRNWSDVLVAPIDLLALPALAVLVEPDLGTAGVIILIGMSMILLVGVRMKSLLTLGLMGSMVTVVAWFGALKDYQKRRILTFIDPEQDIKGAGWNAVQSLIAVGSGRWWGKGHMGGTQSQLSFLPEQHTDFAFSVWAEEQGFVGCLVVLALYALLLLLTIAVAAEAREAYGALLAIGAGALIFWHVVINIGMVSGVLPVVGLTLPLFSYGGSSLLTTMAALGLVLNVHWRRRSHQGR